MQRIVFLDRATIGPSVDLRRPQFAHEWVEHEATPGDDVSKRLAGATIAITNKVPIREAALAELPELKMIAVAATGYDVVDVAACRQRGVRLNARNAERYQMAAPTPNRASSAHASLGATASRTKVPMAGPEDCPTIWANPKRPE